MPTTPPRRGAREPADPEMEPRTPGAPTLHPMAGKQVQSLRTPGGSQPTGGSAAARRNVVRVLCAGRKRHSGRVQNNAGEHIDLIVPDRSENEAAVEEYLDPVGSIGVTPEQRAQLLAGHSADTINIAGQQYHFVGGEVTDVLSAHVPWLEKHPVFEFQVVSG